MELGRIGSLEDTALIMGFLLMLISEQLQSNMRHLTHEQRKALMHLTLVEEGHRLMSAQQTGSSEFTADPRSKGGEDFSNLLAEVRGLGEGVLIAEQIPIRLVQGAIGNTHLKLMHRLEDPASFLLFCDMLNLDERQRVYARTLEQGDIIVRGPTGHPVHVRVANYLDQFQDSADRTLVDDSDDAVREFMKDRFHVPEAQPWEPPTDREQISEPLLSVRELQELYCNTPECEPVLKLPQEAITEHLKEIADAADNQNWEQVRNLCFEQLQKYSISPDPYVARCYLVHVASLPHRTGKSIYEAFASCRAAIKNFRL